MFGKKIGETVITDSKVLANLLLEKYFVATVPGIEFGTEGYLRLSIAAAEKQLDKAVERFHQVESDLR